jgi:hypothetical protein
MSLVTARRRREDLRIMLSEVLALLDEALGRSHSSLIEVPGASPLAQALRATLGSQRAREWITRPAAIVDTTGYPHRFEDALRRLDDGGILILASEVPVLDFEVNVYARLHRRSLTVATVSRPHHGPMLSVRRSRAGGDRRATEPCPAPGAPGRHRHDRRQALLADWRSVLRTAYSCCSPRPGLPWRRGDTGWEPATG